MNGTPSLDKLAAQGGQAIVNQNRDSQEPEKVDNLVTKALGVLQENGVYACGLYLCSRTEKNEKQIAPIVREQMVELLAQPLFGWGGPDSGWEDDESLLLAYLSNTVAGDDKLERLLLAKETLEQMLIYARYGAKAWKASGGEG